MDSASKIFSKKRNTYREFVGKCNEKRPHRRPRHRWKDNIKMDLKETGWDIVDGIHLAQDVDKW